MEFHPWVFNVCGLRNRVLPVQTSQHDQNTSVTKASLCLLRWEPVGNLCSINTVPHADEQSVRLNNAPSHTFIILRSSREILKSFVCLFFFFQKRKTNHSRATISERASGTIELSTSVMTPACSICVSGVFRAPGKQS